MAWSIAWSLAVQAVALRFGWVGLHAVPTRASRLAEPLLWCASLVLFWLAGRHGLAGPWLTSLVAAAPVGLVAAVGMASLVPRRPDDRWLSPAARTGRAPTHRCLPVALEADPSAGALLIEPAATRPPSVVVVVVHGGGNDRLFGLSFLFERLIGHGRAIVTAHLPGHGRGGRDSFSLRGCRARVDRLVRWSRQRFPQAHVVVLGQSLGGALALDLVARGVRCDGVVAVSAPATLRLGRRLWREVGALTRPAVYRALRFASVFEALPAVGAFRRQAFPVRIRSNAGYVSAFSHALEAMDLPRRLPVRAHRAPAVLLVHGTSDGVVPPTDALALAAALGPRAEARLFRRVTHLDALLDDRVVSLIAAWIGQVHDRHERRAACRPRQAA